MYGMFWLFLFVSQSTICDAVTFDVNIDEYVKRLIVDFLSEPESSRYDNVIIPPRLGKKDHEFFLPKVFIWCPMQHFRLEIPCPIHHSPLTASFFTDELQKVSPRNPRLVYDLRGNILLVQRLYICNQGQQVHR